MMEKEVSVLTVLLTILSISMARPELYNMSQIKIPAHLLECYKNPSLYKRENRLPMMMTVLIELIRNIEQHPDFNMDMKNFASLLIDRFQVDGIEEYPAVKGDPQFKVTGYQLNKQFFLRGLIPESTSKLPNNTLTPKEKCSLHFMLSSSIEKKQRGDETTACNVVTGNKKRKRNARALREVFLDTFLPEMKDSVKNASRKVWLNLPAMAMNYTNFPPFSYDDDDVISPEILLKKIKPSISSRVVYTIDEPEILSTTTISSDTTQYRSQSVTAVKVKFTSTASTTSSEQDDQHLNSSYSRFAAVFPIIFKHGEIKPKEKIGNRTVYSVPRVKQPNSIYPESACPVKNGVVYTRWGSVSAGTVLAGIAAGLTEEEVFTYKHGNNVKVNNLWAATLAGELAEAFLMQYPESLYDVQVGLRGNWTDTHYPKRYLIGSPYTEVTDAEIRGGIDGFILGSYVKNWNEITGGTLRLSSLLERYYSTRGVFDPQYQACRRKELYSQLVPTSNKIMNRQVFNFATTMSFGPNVINYVLDGTENSTEDAIETLNNYVSSNIVDSCPVSTTQDPFIDLHVVIDCGWDYDQIIPFLVHLRGEVKAPSRSQFTVFSGQEFRTLMNSTSITMDAADYKNCIQGMNLKKLLEKDLKMYFDQYLEKGSSMSPVKSYPTVVLFIPHNSTSLSSLKAARHAVKDFKKNSPDITLLYLTSSGLDTFRLFVSSMEDVFTYSDIRTMKAEPIITRLMGVPRRITNPSCVPLLSGTKYTTFKYRQVLDFRGVHYYRLHSRYLFPAGDIHIQVREETGLLEVCFSRRNAQPHRGSEATECKTTSGPTSDISLNLSEACIGLKDVLDCPPLYISVQSVDVRPRYQCTKNPVCRAPDDILYTISFTGIACGVGHFLACPFTLIILEAVLTLSRTFYQKQHVYIPTKVLICGYQS